MKKNLYIIIGIAILFIVILIIVYKKGKKQGSINLSVPLIDDPDNTQNNNIPAASNYDLTQLARECYEDMFGINIYHSSVIWNKVNSLSDTDFVKLNNMFNSLYQSSTGESFKQWVASERYVPFTEWSSQQATVLQRMEKLKLS